MSVYHKKEGKGAVRLLAQGHSTPSDQNSPGGVQLVTVEDKNGDVRDLPAHEFFRDYRGATEDEAADFGGKAENKGPAKTT